MTLSGEIQNDQTGAVFVASVASLAVSQKTLLQHGWYY